MDIKELKNIWDRQTKDSLSGQEYTSEEIESMLKKRSMNSVEKIRRNIILELVVGIVLISLLIIMLFRRPSDPFIRITAGFFFLIVVLTSFYYLSKVRQLNMIITGNKDIRETLDQLIMVMKRYISILMKSTLIITPLAVTLGYITGLKFSLGEGYTGLHGNPRILIFMFITLVAITLLIYPLMKFYLQWLYGKHLNDLEKCREELEEE